MVCILTLFKVEKTEGSENVKWRAGLVRYVTFSLDGPGEAHMVLLGTPSHSRVGSPRETRRWILESWRR